jgi:hypothetical protein
MISEKITAVAMSYIEQDEIPPNKGFKDPTFDKAMRAMGFQTGWAWCSIFAKLVWMEAYAGCDPAFRIKLNKHFSPSALGTLHNFAQDPQFTVNQVVVPGGIVIWKHGTDPHEFTGHAGIGITAEGNGFRSVEGNTSPTDPNERNGGTTALKIHQLGLPPNPKGLNFLGCVHPIEF